MKAAFGAEAIGLGNEMSFTCRVGAMTYVRRVTDPTNQRPWLAEITGPDPKYRYARRFLPHKTDYRHSNGKATRGVWFWWTLETGRVYEASYRTSWSGGYTRRFLTVTDDGDIQDLTEEEVRACLASRDWASTS